MQPKFILKALASLPAAAFAAVTAFSPASAQNVTYVSPFQITLDANITSWTTDIANRNTIVNTNDGSWYTTPPVSADYGPLNKQLFGVSNPIDPANQAVEDAIKYDRGDVYSTPLPIPATPSGVDPTTYYQQRMMYVASSLIGTVYQHLHLPTFDPWSNGYNVTSPPPVWPWLAVTNADENITTKGYNVDNIYKAQFGTGTAGIDCTDFTAYVYNVALGIQLNSGTSTQIEFSTNSKPEVGNTPSSNVLAADGTILTPTFYKSPNYGTGAVNLDGSLDGVISQLQPGDLLYISANPGGAITHVVMWLGEYGTYVNGTLTEVPLVISSHDNTPSIFDVWGSALDPTTGLPLGVTSHDDAGIAEYLPPPGVHILPFTSDNWFYQNFAVASHILPATVPEPSTIALCCGLVALGCARLRKRK